jgi:hypothetical protein
MARKKRTSTVLEVAQRRLAGLKSIDAEFDLGSNMKQSDFEAVITGLSTRLNLYNQHSAALDQEQNDLDAEERIVRLEQALARRYRREVWHRQQRV